MPRKAAVTLMGMSGVGKSFFSKQLESWGWKRYSCDEEIGKNILNDGSIDIAHLNTYLGKLGDPAQGGLGLAEFKRRQKLYYDAECAALLHVGKEVNGSDRNFVHDSTGSLCEMEDEKVIRHVGENSLIVYIEATKEHAEEVLTRAVKVPKPIFFPPSKFDGWVAQYLKDHNLTKPEEMDPAAFFGWVFPILFKERLPKYERIANQYGITISSEDLKKADHEDAFLKLIKK